MDRLGALTGRKYHLFRYAGHPQAERVVVAIGSAVEVLEETAAWLSANAGEKVGVLQVNLYRPWDGDAFLAAMPKSTKSVAVLDRTKEVGGPGEPLYVDVISTYARALAAGKLAAMPTIIGGRYGLSSKDFDPPMAKAVFDELKKQEPRHGFTVGITDDVSNTSLPVDHSFDIETADTVRALFYGLGADGTVGANKNSTKILASEPGRYAQGYFVYDSKKSGSYTISHLRFGPKPIHAPYLIKSASFIGVHKFDYLFKIDMLAAAAQGGTVLLKQPVRAGRSLERAAARGAEADHRQEAEAARHRRVEGRVLAWSGLPHQHHPADLLLRTVRRDAARGGDCGDQEGDGKDLCPQGEGSCQEELRSHRCGAGQLVRGQDSHCCQRRPSPLQTRAGHRA
jgi:pyruvate-ferredoxin/flavodoxin oxidoreductase